MPCFLKPILSQQILIFSGLHPVMLFPPGKFGQWWFLRCDLFTCFMTYRFYIPRCIALGAVLEILMLLRFHIQSVYDFSKVINSISYSRFRIWGFSVRNWAFGCIGEVLSWEILPVVCWKCDMHLFHLLLLLLL